MATKKTTDSDPFAAETVDVSAPTVDSGSRDDPDGRWVYVEAFDSFVTQNGVVYPAGDFDKMVAGFNAVAVEEELQGYAQYLEQIAIRELSRPAKEGGVIRRGPRTGQKSDPKPAFTPDAKQVERWIATELKHARRAFSWILSK